MKVVHLLLTGEPGGIEMLAYSIAQHSQNENIMWFLFRGGTVAEQMKTSGISVKIAGVPRYRWHRSIKEFIRYCREENVEIVINHIYSPVACAHVLALKRNIPDIKIFGYLHSEAQHMLVGWKNRFGYVPFARAMYQCCNKVFAISQYVKNTAIDAYGLSEDKITVVYNGVDIDRFSKETEQKTCERLELIYVGRLVPIKGVHLLLDALVQVKSEDIHTTIVGSGPEYDTLLQQVELLQLTGKVDFLGKRMDIPELLQKADWFIHPAICQEGFGITIVEAMAAGKPCIAFRGGAIPEIIEDGVDGYLVAMHDVDALAEAIRKAYHQHHTERYRQMSAAAERKAKSYHIADMVKQLEALY